MPDGTSAFSVPVTRLVSLGAPQIDPVVRSRSENFVKASVTPRGMRPLLRQLREADLRDVLPAIRVPTLVIHPSRDQLFPVSHGRLIAERIPGARFLEPDSDLHIFHLDLATTAHLVSALEEFLTGRSATPPTA